MKVEYKCACGASTVISDTWSSTCEVLSCKWLKEHSHCVEVESLRAKVAELETYIENLPAGTRGATAILMRVDHGLHTLLKDERANTDQLQKQVAELEAEKDAFYMEYRMKCDKETKELHAMLREIVSAWDDKEGASFVDESVIEKARGMIG